MVKAQLGKLVIANGIYRLLIFVAALGVAFCAAGLYLLLTNYVGKPGAALCTGLALLSLVGIPCAFVAGKLNTPAPNKAESAEIPEQLLQDLLGGRNLDDLVRNNSKQAVLAALAAGLLAGASPKARSGLVRLLEEFSAEHGESR